MDKKSNMAHWDKIDDISEEFVHQFVGCAAEKLELDDDDVTDIARIVRDTVLDGLENLGIDIYKCFPCDDKNY